MSRMIAGRALRGQPDERDPEEHGPAVHDGPFRTIADVEYATAGWVDWYNNRRLHSSLGYLTPEEHEQAHYAALHREPQPV